MQTIMNIRVIDFFLLILGIGIASTSTILNGDYAFFNSLWPGLIGIVVSTTGLIHQQAIVHAEQIEEGRPIIHWKASLLRFIVILVLCIIFHVYYFHITKIIDLMLFSFCWFGLLFNPILNYKRELPFFYLAKGTDHPALLDRMFRNFKYGGEILFGLELVALIITGYIYLIK